MLTYRALLPRPALQEFATRIVVFEGKLLPGAVFDQTIVPSLTEFITFNLNGNPQFFFVQDQKLLFKDCFISGLHSCRYQANLSGDIKIVGVQIKTSYLHRLFAVPMHYLVNTAMTLEELIGNEARDFCDSLLGMRTVQEAIFAIENYLLHKWRMCGESAPHHTIFQSLSLIRDSRGTKPMKELISDTKTSERTLQRLFLQHVGLSPKIFSRIHRFNEVLWHFNASHRLSPDLMYELGYFDQAHFIHDFKYFSGESPKEYFKNHPGINEFFSNF